MEFVQLALTIIFSFLALGFAVYFAKWVLQHDEGTPEMRSISDAIREGADAFLSRQYSTIACPHPAGCRHHLLFICR